MGKVKITQGRDFEYTLFLKDKDGKPVDITGHSFIRLQKGKEDGSILNFNLPAQAAVDEVQKISFPSDPTSGSFALDYGDGNVTGLINFNDNAAAVEALINALNVFSQVSVSGSITQATGLTITYTGNDGGRAQPNPSIVTNTLSDGAAVVPTVAALTAGVAESGLTVVSAERGEIKVKGSEADSNSLTGQNKPGVLEIKIGSKDLNIPTIQDLYDVDVNPLV